MTTLMPLKDSQTKVYELHRHHFGWYAAQNGLSLVGGCCRQLTDQTHMYRASWSHFHVEVGSSSTVLALCMMDHRVNREARALSGFCAPWIYPTWCTRPITFAKSHVKISSSLEVHGSSPCSVQYHFAHSRAIL